MSKNIISITLITVIAGLLLGLTYTVTKKPIEKSKISAVNNAYKKIIKEADEFKNDNSFDSSKAKNILKDGLLLRKDLEATLSYPLEYLMMGAFLA